MKLEMKYSIDQLAPKIMAGIGAFTAWVLNISWANTADALMKLGMVSISGLLAGLFTKLGNQLADKYFPRKKRSK